MQRDMDSLRTAIEQVDRGQFEQMVDKLLKAQHIYLLGMRSSSFLTGYLNFYFRLIFKNVTLVQNAVAGETFEQLVQVQPGDVLLAISFPRYSKMTVNAVQYAREKGRCGGHHRQYAGPLYPLASAALLVRSDMISFVDSITAPLSLLNALIVTVGQRKNEEVPETFSELERVWSQYSVFGKTEDE